MELFVVVIIDCRGKYNPKIPQNCCDFVIATCSRRKKIHRFYRVNSKRTLLGVLPQGPYKEGQEDQLGALRLVLNVLILWNTTYIQAIINQLKNEGYEILQEDLARISPLAYHHFNFLGRYSFRLEGLPAEGKLRPLRKPDSEMIETFLDPKIS